MAAGQSPLDPATASRENHDGIGPGALLRLRQREREGEEPEQPDEQGE